MRLRQYVTLLAPAVAVGLLLSGCSLVLAWDEDGHPCNENNECYDGYSCRARKCIPVGSLGEGESCTDDDQCENDLTCEAFACRTQCSQYLTTTGCGTGQYCKPILVAGDTCEGGCGIGEFRRDDEEDTCRCHYYQGICIEGDGCTVATEIDDCEAGHVCVAMSASVDACLEHCEVYWSNDEYNDTCGSLPGAPRYCTAVGGTVEGTRLVCIDTFVGAAGQGDSCEWVAPTPCRAPEDFAVDLSRGLACVATECRVHCLPGGSIMGNSFCDSDPAHGGSICCTVNELSDGDDTYGVCDTDCNAY